MRISSHHVFNQQHYGKHGLVHTSLKARPTAQLVAPAPAPPVVIEHTHVTKATPEEQRAQTLVCVEQQAGGIELSWTHVPASQRSRTLPFHRHPS